MVRTRSERFALAIIAFLGLQLTLSQVVTVEAAGRSVWLDLLSAKWVVANTAPGRYDTRINDTVTLIQFSPLLVAVVYLALPPGSRVRRPVWWLLMVLTTLSFLWLALGLLDH